MKATEYLSQAYTLDQQIQTKLQQIASLRALAGTLRPFTGNEPVSHTRNVTALEDTVIKIMEEEQALNEQIACELHYGIRTVQTKYNDAIRIVQRILDERVRDEAG